MDEKEYREEIELIKEQNNVEFEIYPMAVEIIQPTIKNLSKRYVFARRKSTKGQIYYGISSFPDVAIIEKDFKNKSNNLISIEDWDKLKGCLEVKSLESDLISAKEIKKICSEKPDKLKQDMGQLIGEILWYKKVIYTNGIEWRLLYIKEYSEQLKEKIVSTVNERIVFERDEKKIESIFDWWANIKNIDFEIEDECITKNCIEYWDSFIENIKKIKWD